MRIAGVMLTAIGAVAIMWAIEAAPSGPTPSLLYTVTKRYEPLAWLRGADRFPKGASIFLEAEGDRRSFVRGFAASADPTVSFDGEQVLFAGKRHPRDHWQIWEVTAPGESPRQVTACTGDCVRPFYLPENRVVYARRLNGSFVIEAASLAGEKPLRLTYLPGNFLPTAVLHDGRVLFESAYPLGASSMPELYTVYPDGSGVESYRCDHGQPRYAGRQIASGDIVFVQQRGIARFTSALAHQVSVAVPPGDYAGDVVETADGNWLLARRSKLSEHYQLFRWKLGEGNTSAPNRFPSALHDWNYANLLCLNAYTARYSFAEGAIASVRLYTRGTKGDEVMLGTEHVEQDGSFYLRTPADQPLKIELLDRSGKTLKKEAGWFWLRKGEQRICVGCHAGPETAPENALPQVLQRSTVAADMTKIPASVLNAQRRPTVHGHRAAKTLSARGGH
jgi:hypothetical protein